MRLSSSSPVLRVALTGVATELPLNRSSEGSAAAGGLECAVARDCSGGSVARCQLPPGVHGFDCLEVGAGDNDGSVVSEFRYGEGKRHDRSAGAGDALHLGGNAGGKRGAVGSGEDDVRRRSCGILN